MPTAAAPLDTLYAVETPEGIALTLRPAGLAARALACMIDMCLRGALAFIFVMALASTTFGSGLSAALVLIGFFLLEWFYPVIFELGKRGATPGKRALGLRVVMDNGLPVTPAASLLRNLLRVVDFLPGTYAVGLATLLLRPDFKRLGDMAAGTLVVYADTAALDGPLPAAEPLPPTRLLTARQQLAVITWAGRSRRLTPERLDELARLAASVSIAPAEVGAPLTARLLGVAHWLSGRRGAGEAP
ncbi:MAG: RDD family protein [Azonexus sp.]|nr:RDD family protein [Azonexus sp.]